MLKDLAEKKQYGRFAAQVKDTKAATEAAAAKNLVLAAEKVKSAYPYLTKTAAEAVARELRKKPSQPSIPQPAAPAVPTPTPAAPAKVTATPTKRAPKTAQKPAPKAVPTSKKKADPVKVAPAQAPKPVAKKAATVQPARKTSGLKNLLEVLRKQGASLLRKTPAIGRVVEKAARIPEPLMAFIASFMFLLAVRWPLAAVFTGLLGLGFLIQALLVSATPSKADDVAKAPYTNWGLAMVVTSLALLVLRGWGWSLRGSGLAPALAWISQAINPGIMIFLGVAVGLGALSAFLYVSKAEKIYPILTALGAGLMLGVTFHSWTRFSVGAASLRTAIITDAVVLALAFLSLAVFAPLEYVSLERSKLTRDKNGVEKATSRVLAEQQPRKRRLWRLTAIVGVLCALAIIGSFFVPGLKTEDPKATTSSPIVWGDKVVKKTVTTTATPTATATVDTEATSVAQTVAVRFETAGIPTDTPPPTATPTETPTSTPTEMPTSTSTTATVTQTTKSASPTITKVAPTTVVPPTATTKPTEKPTNTPVTPPTATNVPPAPKPTDTPRPPEPTNTSVPPPPPTNTSAPPAPTNTPVPPTNTPEPTQAPATSTPKPTINF